MRNCFKSLAGHIITVLLCTHYTILKKIVVCKGISLDPFSVAVQRSGTCSPNLLDLAIFGTHGDPKITRFFPGASMSNFCILRIKKLHADSNVAGALAHHLRTRETDNADPEKIRRNWYSGNEYLKDENGRLDRSSNEDIEARRKMKAVALAKYRRNLPEKIRKNAVRSVEFMMTVSPEVMSRKDFNSVKYLNDCANWVREKFGKENVFFVAHHNDETTPHISILITPKDENGKLNARKFFGGREKLSELQDSFYKEVGKAHGLERGIRGSKAHHKTIQTWYAEQNQEARKLENVARELTERIPEKRLLQNQEEHQAEIFQAVTSALNEIRPEMKKAINARQTEERLQDLRRNFDDRVKSGIEAGKEKLQNDFDSKLEKQTAELRKEKTQLYNTIHSSSVVLKVNNGEEITCKNGLLQGFRNAFEKYREANAPLKNWRNTSAEELIEIANGYKKYGVDNWTDYEEAKAREQNRSKGRDSGGFSYSD